MNLLGSRVAGTRPRARSRPPQGECARARTHYFFLVETGRSRLQRP